MAERLPFQARQYAFAAHIRDPEGVAVPDGIDERRMAVYRDLFFNNLRNLLATLFPVLRKLHDDVAWRRLVRGFLREHRSRTPYFLELPREFVAFLADEYAPEDGDFPFLAELAHYEYAELEVSIDNTPGRAGVDPAGSLLDGVPVRIPACRVYAYRWPVHRITAEYTPTEPSAEPVILAIYRRRNDKVRFLELNAVTAQLLERIGGNAARDTGTALLSELARDTGWADAAAFVAHGHDILDEMRSLGILSGSVAGCENGGV